MLIDIRVEVKHEVDHVVEGANHVFSYWITIRNHSTETIQLERRHWFISDGFEHDREVEGEGVVGQTPILEPNQEFSYQSWCPTVSELGVMSGYYQFRLLRTSEEFDVEIPAFVLMPSYQLN